MRAVAGGDRRACAGLRVATVKPTVGRLVSRWLPAWPWPTDQWLWASHWPVKTVRPIFLGFILKAENELKLAKFISIQILIRKMQLIYQNVQQGNFFLLVPLVDVVNQNKLPVFNKYRNGRNKWEFVKSITL